MLSARLSFGEGAASSAGVRAPGLPQVLFVTDHLGYPEGVVHGGTTYHTTVLPGLARHGVVARLCVLGKTHSSATALRAKNVETIFLNRPRWDPLALHDLRALMRQLRPNLLHLTTFKSTILGGLLAGKAGLGTVLHFHDRKMPPLLLGPLLRHFARQARAAIAVSESVRDFAAQTYRLPPVRITVLRNGIDLAATRTSSAAERAAQRERLGLAADAPVIAIVGRLVPNKRQALLIRIMPAILQAAPGAVLLVVGDGPQRLACEKQARRLRLGPAVRFLGQRQDVEEILAATDVLALTSIDEGLPYVLLEAAARGVPAVAFATGGVPEIVRHERTGLLVPPNDADALATALIRLVRDPELARRLGATAREQAARFDLQSHLAELASLYCHLLTSPGQRSNLA